MFSFLTLALRMLEGWTRKRVFRGHEVCQVVLGVLRAETH